jgi:hypothetical protein
MTKYRIVKEPKLITGFYGLKVEHWYYAERAVVHLLFFNIWMYQSGTGSYSFKETKERLDVIMKTNMSEETVWKNYEGV